jgi:hypothetical protein
MLRYQLLVFVLLAAPLPAQMWPESWREHKRVSQQPVTLDEPGLFTEFGGEAAETALYSGPAGKFRATGWRFKDATGALAWFESLRPEEGVPVRGTALIVTTPGALWMAHQNYAVKFEGWRPTPLELDTLWPLLPDARSRGGLPLYAGYLPDSGRIRNSERLVLGVTSLERFAKQIPPIAVGFEDSAELALARYHSPSGEMTLAVISYPTPQLARLRAAEFEKLPKWEVKRTGSFVAVVPEAPDPAAAGKLLEQINYNANFIWNQAAKMPPMPDVGGMLGAIVDLTGLLLVVCVGGGVLFALLQKYLRGRTVAATGSESTMTFLHI